MGFAEFEGRLWSEYRQDCQLPWITPIGHHGRRHLKHGQQFCVDCLREDAHPYFRRSWRLAFNVLCEKHSVYLLDACPICGAPVEFHAGDFGVRLLPLECPITLCPNCNHDYRYWPGHAFPANPEAIEFQVHLTHCLNFGWGHTLPGSINYSHLFFAGLRQLVQLAPSRGRFSRVLHQLQLSLGMLDFGPPQIATPFEFRRIHERAWIIEMCRLLLTSWPANFISICKRSRVSSSYFFSYRSPYPYWFESEIRWHLNDRDYTPTKAERMSAKSWLLKRSLPVSANALNQLLGVSYYSRLTTQRPGPKHTWNPRGPTSRTRCRIG